MNFLIQGKNNLPEFDFGFELVKSIEFQEEVLDEKRQYLVSENPILDLSINDYKNWCPVGSVEFVHKYFKSYNIPFPKPINIPKELYLNSGLKPKIVYGPKKFNKTVFIKSVDKIKHVLNGPDHEIKKGIWQVTDFLHEGFDSEWRCFVHHKKLIDCKLYSGDWKEYPDIEYINSTIDLWKNAPIAYTLDIGMYKSNPYIIECHNFYSCGLYGFSNRFKYPQMLAQWYIKWLKNKKIY